MRYRYSLQIEREIAETRHLLQQLGATRETVEPDMERVIAVVEHVRTCALYCADELHSIVRSYLREGKTVTDAIELTRRLAH